MCGITGWIDFFRDLTLERHTVEAMTGALRLRGPDAEGIWIAPHVALGHRRLAVVDVEGGRQPMEASRGEGESPVVLTYNGELYNYRELRIQLAVLGHRFRTSSDTEVILRAYLEWGTGVVDRLTGMYAFAIWDGAREELLLVRDRLGVKPLYYHAYEGGLLFASEPKAILANPLFKPRASERGLPVLLDPRLAMPWETPFTDLRQVQPGHMVRVDRSGAHETPYWRLVSREHHDDHATTVRTVRELLEDAVVHQLVTDVPPCTLLSGGLDSGAVTALASVNQRRGLHDVHSFSLDFQAFDATTAPATLRPGPNAPFALAVARHLGIDHTSVTLDPSAVPDDVPGAAAGRDLPVPGRLDAAMFLLLRQVRECSTVVMSGDAADEVFGGYPWFFDRATVWGDTFPWLGDGARAVDCLAPDARSRIRPEEDERDRYATLRARVPQLTGETGLEARMREVLHLNLQGPLQFLLDRVDRMSMALGLEVRMPFCDHRLLEYVWNVPWKMKIADGRAKSLLRSAVGDLLPPEVLYRDKTVTRVPFPAAQADAARRELETLLADPTSPLTGLLDTAKVRDLDARRLLPLIEVDRWLRDYDVSLTD